MATHSSTLAWKIPWMEEHGRLSSMGSQRVRHDWATSLSLSFFLSYNIWVKLLRGQFGAKSSSFMGIMNDRPWRFFLLYVDIAEEILTHYMNLVIWLILVLAVTNTWVVSSIFATFDYINKILRHYRTKNI